MIQQQHGLLDRTREKLPSRKSHTLLALNFKVSRLQGADCPPLKCQGQPERRACCPLLPFSLISAAAIFRGRPKFLFADSFFLVHVATNPVESCQSSLLTVAGTDPRRYLRQFFCSTLHWRGWGSQSGQATTMGSLNNVRAHLSVVTNSAKQKTSQLLCKKNLRRHAVPRWLSLSGRVRFNGYV